MFLMFSYILFFPTCSAVCTCLTVSKWTGPDSLLNMLWSRAPLNYFFPTNFKCGSNDFMRVRKNRWFSVKYIFSYPFYYTFCILFPVTYLWLLETIENYFYCRLILHAMQYTLVSPLNLQQSRAKQKVLVNISFILCLKDSM